MHNHVDNLSTYPYAIPMLSTTFSTFVENYMRVTQTHVRIHASPLRRLRSRNRTPVCSPLPDRGAALPAEIRVCAMARRALRSLTLLLTRHIYINCLIKCRVEQCCFPLPHQYEIARANTTCNRAASLPLRDSLCKGAAVLRVCCINLRADCQSRPAAQTSASAERHITRKTTYKVPQIRI